MTEDELRALPVAFDLVTAGRAINIGRTTAYDLAKRGDFPVRVVKVGDRYRVTKADLFEYRGVGKVSAA